MHCDTSFLLTAERTRTRCLSYNVWGSRAGNTLCPHPQMKPRLGHYPPTLSVQLAQRYSAGKPTMNIRDRCSCTPLLRIPATISVGSLVVFLCETACGPRLSGQRRWFATPRCEPHAADDVTTSNIPVCYHCRYRPPSQILTSW